METKERIMPDKAVTLIDLDDIIRTRAGKKARYIPGFLINGLKRLIHPKVYFRDKDIYREKCGCPAGCGADTFHRAEFRPLLFHRGMVQTVASQV